MKNKRKTIAPRGIDNEEKKIIARQEKNQLIFGADALLPVKSPDREIEKFELQNGRKISLKDIKDVVTGILQDYHVMFIEPFYKEIFRLNKWTSPTNQRPHIVAIWTNELIYARFSQDVLPRLQLSNPYNELGIRNYKHFQFLNDEGKFMLAGYIQDAIRIMKTCKTWHDFRKVYGKEYKIPFQGSLYESN